MVAPNPGHVPGSHGLMCWGAWLIKEKDASARQPAHNAALFTSYPAMQLASMSRAPVASTAAASAAAPAPAPAPAAPDLQSQPSTSEILPLTAAIAPPPVEITPAGEPGRTSTQDSEAGGSEAGAGLGGPARVQLRYRDAAALARGLRAALAKFSEPDGERVLGEVGAAHALRALGGLADAHAPVLQGAPALGN